MSEFSIENQTGQESAGTPFPADSVSRSPAARPRYTLLDGIAALPPAPATKAAPTPDMVRPRNAWRRLCAATGGGIAMGTFYRWIRNGRLYTVRLGGRVFVPLSALEALIENCLRGESL